MTVLYVIKYKPVTPKTVPRLITKKEYIQYQPFIPYHLIRA